MPAAPHLLHLCDWAYVRGAATSGVTSSGGKRACGLLTVGSSVSPLVNLTVTGRQRVLACLWEGLLRQSESTLSAATTSWLAQHVDGTHPCVSGLVLLDPCKVTRLCESNAAHSCTAKVAPSATQGVLKYADQTPFSTKAMCQS